jgi:hypothetical protein
MDYRPYIAGVLLLGSVACLLLVIALMRRRQAAAGGSESRSAPSMPGHLVSRDSAVAARSLTEMLDYYAPIDSRNHDLLPADESDIATGAERTSAAKDATGSLEPEGVGASSGASSSPAFVHVRSVLAPAPSDDPDAPRLLAPAAPPVTHADESQAANAKPDEPLSAPVEIWFEDGRVGVEDGSKTHRQFRKYADALLGDLKATRSDTR